MNFAAKWIELENISEVTEIQNNKLLSLFLLGPIPQSHPSSAAEHLWQPSLHPILSPVDTTDLPFYPPYPYLLLWPSPQLQ